MSDVVEIFTDGSCSGNPGPGGWGVLLKWNDEEREIYGGAAHTTNNRMELMAVIEGLNALKRPCTIRVTTDSQYVKNGIEKWLTGWKAKGWKGSDKKPIKNQDLWELLDEATQRHKISWHWVKGHSGHAENERADQLANKGREAL